MRKKILLVLAVLVVAACGRGEPTTGLADDRFIDVVVSLRRASLETRGDPAAFQARRDQILHDAGVTEEELRQYVDAHARDLQHMAAIWDSINARLATPE